MNLDFKNINYLKTGNSKQRLAYEALSKIRIFETLQQFDPILVGTIPIGIDIENSDLDIICYVENDIEFEKILTQKFSYAPGFKLWKNSHLSPQAIVARFKAGEFEIEVFGQNKPTNEQYAYQHMVIEHKILLERGENFRQRIIKLKQKGYKTEPAFSIALELEGNPYEALLEYKLKN
jgi:hypothetical protein